MAHADWIIDLGPGAGHDGGRVVFEGTPADPGGGAPGGVRRWWSTLTGEHLAARRRRDGLAPLEIAKRSRSASSQAKSSSVHGARAELPAARSPARRRQVGRWSTRRPPRRGSLPVAARHADRARGRERHPAHRRRALGVLPAARAAAGERRSRSACSSTSCPRARRTCRRRSTRCCSSGGSASSRCRRHVGGGGRQPRAGSRAGALAELGARQPREHPERPRGRAGVARLGAANGVRADVLNFISYMPDALMRPVPADPQPFSTPRSWTLLSRGLDLAESGGILTRQIAAGARLRPGVGGGRRGLLRAGGGVHPAHAAARRTTSSIPRACPPATLRAGSS
jgi:hypothetical protein